MKKKIDPQEIKVAEKILRKLILGTSLGLGTFSGDYLQLDFLRSAAMGLPHTLYLTTCETVFVLPIETKTIPRLPEDGKPFFDQRGKALGQIHSLMGVEVTSVKISPDGVLEIEMEEHKICVAPQKMEFTEVFWAIRSDTIDPYAHHDWSVAFVDEIRVIMKTPDSKIKQA